MMTTGRTDAKRNSVSSINSSIITGYHGTSDQRLAAQWVTPQGLGVTIASEEIIFADNPDKSLGLVLSHTNDEIIAVMNGSRLHGKLVNERLIWSNGEVWASRSHRRASTNSFCCPSRTTPPPPEGDVGPVVAKQAGQPSGFAVDCPWDSDHDFDGSLPQECTLQSRPKRMPRKSTSGSRMSSVQEETGPVVSEELPQGEEEVLAAMHTITTGSNARSMHTMTTGSNARSTEDRPSTLHTAVQAAVRAASANCEASDDGGGAAVASRHSVNIHRRSMAEAITMSEESDRRLGLRVSQLTQQVRGWMQEVIHRFTNETRSRNSWFDHRVSTRSSMGDGAVLNRLSAGPGARNKAPASILQRIVKSPWFEFFFTLAIMGNAVLIGMEIEFQATQPDKYDEGQFAVCHLALSLTFVVELCMRIKAHGCLFFCNEEWKWNLFDTILVAHSIVDMILDLIFGGSETTQTLSGQRTLRVLRMVRNLRIVRMLRVFQELRMMLYAILGCFKALLWLVLLLVLLLYFFAVFFTQGTVQFLSTNSDMDLNSPDTDVGKLKDMYGSLAISMFSLYKGMSNGVSWGELVVPLQKHLHWFYVVLMLVFISFAIFAVLNVVTSVFVDSAMCQTAEEAEHKHAEAKRQARHQLIKMQQLFCEIDADESGYVSIAEFMEGLSDPNIVKCFELLGIETSEAEQLFHLLDPEDVGEVAIDEFVRGCTRLKGEARSFDIACLLCEQRRLMYRFCHLEAVVSSWADSSLAEENAPTASRLALVAQSLVESTSARPTTRSELPQDRSEPSPRAEEAASFRPEDDNVNAPLSGAKV